VVGEKRDGGMLLSVSWTPEVEQALQVCCIVLPRPGISRSIRRLARRRRRGELFNQKSEEVSHLAVGIEDVGWKS